MEKDYNGQLPEEMMTCSHSRSSNSS